MTVQALTTIPSFSPAWKRVEEHYGAAFRFGRQAVEEAWRCGDALIAAKAETPHGEWLPALKAVGIHTRYGGAAEAPSPEVLRNTASYGI